MISYYVNSASRHKIPVSFSKEKQILMFIFKRNCASIPGASLAGENMASRYCVKPCYIEQGCNLCSRFL